LPNPTPDQVRTALGIALRAQARAVGPNPGVQRIREYQQELLGDPRNQEYVQTLMHYQRAGEAQRRAEGPTSSDLTPSDLTPVLNLADAYQARGLSRAAAFSRALTAYARMRTETSPEAKSARAQAIRESEPRLGVPGLGLLGTIPARPIIGALQSAANVDLGIGGLSGKIVNEVVDLPGQAILSGATAGAALAEGVKKGNWKPSQRVGEGAVKTFTDPSEWLNHPVSSALMLGGAEAVVGGLAGKAARSGAFGERVAQAASTARPDLKLLGGEPGLRVVGRKYNPDPFRSAFQHMYEKSLPKLPGDLRQVDPFQAEGWRLKRAIKGGVVRPGRVDIVQQAGDRMAQDTTGRRVQEVMAHETRRTPIVQRVGGAAAVSKGEAAGASAAQRAIFEGWVTSPERASAQLQQRLSVLQDAEKGLHPLTGPKVKLAEPKPLVGEALALNRNSQRVVREAIEHPPTARTFALTRAMVEAQKPTTAGLIGTGALQPEELRASLFGHGIERMGARYYTVADHQAAEAAAKAAGKSPAEIAAVSGRGPVDQVLAHEAVLKEHAEARSAVPKAQEALRRAEGARSRLVGVQRAGGASSGQQARAASGGGDAMAAADAKVAGAREALRAAQAEHTVARNAAADSKLPETKAGLRKANGEYLPSQEILDHMHAEGVPHAGYVSHEPPPLGARVLKGSGRRPPLAGSKGPRTGAAFINGTFDHSFGSLVGQTAKENTYLARHLFENAKAARFGVGGPASKPAIEEFIKNFAATAEGKRVTGGLGQLEPHLIGPKAVMESGAVSAPHEAAQVLKQFGLAQHTPADLAAPGQWTAMPRMVSERFSAHGNVSASTEAGRALEAWVQLWRRAKLYTSTRHVFGVTQEQAIRLAAENVLPKALGGRAGRLGAKWRTNLQKLADDNGPLGPQYRELAAMQGQRGGLYSTTEARDIVAKGDAFQRSSVLGYVTKGVEGGTEARATQTVLKPWRVYYHALQKGMGKVEQQTHDAMLGKTVAEFFGGYRKVLKMQDDTVQALIKNKFDDNMAAAFANRVDDLYGNWTHLPPSVRRAVNEYSPFGLWALNSLRWLYRLPVTHPIKTAVAAALYAGTRAVRNEEGQGFDAPHPAPGFLQGTIPVDLPVVGTMIEPGPTLAGMVLPQFGSILAAAKEQNPLSGAKLTRKGGGALKSSDTALNVLAELLTGPVPGATQAQQFLQRSGKPYGTANLLTDVASKLGGSPQIKPGTEHSLEETLVKMFLPTRFSFPSKVGATHGGSSSSAAPSSPRDLVREGLRNEALKEHERDSVREAIREGLRREARGR
jgi:hypothetical protein